MELGLFGNESDAYKLAIAYAQSRDLSIDQAPSHGYGTKFNAAGGLDRDGMVRDLVTTLLPNERERPYATAERLAEIGLLALAERIAAQETLADILMELQPQRN